jgi:site-specific recombinase XerD
MDQDEASAKEDGDPKKRYPDYMMPIAGSLPERHRRFAELREEMLVRYGYQTARAYRADTEDFYAWAEARGLDVLALTEPEIRRYLTLLRRRKYSENTLRRRVTSLRALYDLMVSLGLRGTNPAKTVVVRRGTRPQLNPGRHSMSRNQRRRR